MPPPLVSDELQFALPMARSAVLVGRTLADLVRNVFVVLLMSAMGFLVGWRIHTNVIAMLAGLLLVVAFAYSLSWVFAIVGMSVPDGETAQAASFPLLAPLVFASSAFVSVNRMPGWLQPVGRRRSTPAPRRRAPPRPIAIRRWPPRANRRRRKSLRRNAISTAPAIIAICAPLAVAKYRRTV